MLCLGLNAIIGSGIYAFPGSLAAWLGPASCLAFALGGAASALIGLCFAEAAGAFRRSGGPYVYGQAAFGPTVGFLVGWSCWGAALFSWAAVARAIEPYLGHLWAPLGRGACGTAAVVGITILLGAVNYVGIKPGAYIANLLTAAKLLPLFVLVAAGARKGLLPRGAFAPHGLRALPRATLLTFFAFQGFEVVPVPAGETANSTRAAPIAVLGSLLGATVLYMAVQWTAVASTAALPGAEQPLAEMGHVLLGNLGGHMVAAAAVISMLGFCAGVALAGPRYLEPLGADDHLPRVLSERHRRFATPHRAILLTTGATCALVVLLPFGALAGLSVVTVSMQYLVTCLAVPVLRRRRPELPRAFRLPLGPLIPGLASLVVLWLSAQAERAAVLGCLALLALGFIFKLVTARASRQAPRF